MASAFCSLFSLCAYIRLARYAARNWQPFVPASGWDNAQSDNSMVSVRLLAVKGDALPSHSSGGSSNSSLAFGSARLFDTAFQIIRGGGGSRTQRDMMADQSGKGKNTSGRGQRDLKVKVKSARGRKLSSTRWLQRQLNDPYVKRARVDGYRGRAAYKILELDDKYRFLVPGARVVDLGCAPGGWCQVAVPRVNALGEKSGKARGRVIGIDLQEVEPIAGVELYQLDFMEDGADDKVRDWLGSPADVVMSDMAAASSGHKQTDHLRIISLCEAAAYFAFDVLDPGGTFVAKVLAGGAEGELQKLLKQRFDKVANVKPPASRSDSSEKFVVATGFRG